MVLQHWKEDILGRVLEAWPRDHVNSILGVVWRGEMTN